MRTRTAPLTHSKDSKSITCTSNGQKDFFGKTIWHDENGSTYELVNYGIAGFAFYPSKPIIK